MESNEKFVEYEDLHPCGGCWEDHEMDLDFIPDCDACGIRRDDAAKFEDWQEQRYQNERSADAAASKDMAQDTLNAADAGLPQMHLI